MLAIRGAFFYNEILDPSVGRSMRRELGAYLKMWHVCHTLHMKVLVISQDEQYVGTTT